MLSDRLKVNNRTLKEFAELEFQTISPGTRLTDAIALMNQHHCSCLLIESQHRLAGILTERDLVDSIASGTDFAGITVAEVMTSQPITLSTEDNFTPLEIVAFLEQHKIRHLPLVDVLGKPVGVITHQSLRKTFDNSYLLRQRTVKEVMTHPVIHTTGDRSIGEIARIMATNRISCVVIVEADTGKKLHPLGIVTERDLVQFKALNLDLERLPIHRVMSCPLFPIRPDANLQDAHELMLHHHIRRLVAVDDEGYLAGIITQTCILTTLDSREIQAVAELLSELVEEQTKQLKVEQAIKAEQQQQLELIQGRLNSILAEITDLVFLVTPDEPSISVISENFGNFDLQKHELIQQTIEQFWRSSTSQTFLTQAQQALKQKQKINFEYSIYLPDRSRFWFSAQISAISDDTVVWIARDTTIVKVAQKQQITANIKLEQLVDARTKELQLANKLLQEQIINFFSFDRPKSRTKNRQNSLLQPLIPTNNRLAVWLNRLQRRNFPSWTGAVVALIIISLIESFRRAGITVPIPFMLLIITVSMSANLGGVVAGLWSHSIWSLYVIYAAVIGFGPTTLTGGVAQMTAGIVVMGVFAVVQGWTKEQNRWLRATSIHLNSNLEQEIHQRTRQLAIANANLEREIEEHIASKKALLASEQKFRAIFEQAGVGITLTGVDKKLLQVNPKFCQFIGYSAEELQTVTFDRITHPDDRLTDSHHLRQMRFNQLPTLVKEKRYIHKNGSVVWGNITVVPVKNERQQPDYFIAVIEDITKRKRAELALQESEARFISLLNACPFLVWTSGTDALCNFFNTAWLDFTGRTLEQELGNGWTTGVHPQDLDFCLQTYQTAFARQKKFGMEYRLQKRNGKYGWIYDEGIPRFKADGSFAGYIGTCVDISDRVKAKKEREQLLAEIDRERQFLQTVLQQMPAGIIIGEPPWGNIILKNQRVESILRHSLKPITKLEDYQQFSCLQDDGRPLPLEDYALLHVCRGEEFPSREYNYLCGDGVIRTLIVNGAPVRNYQQQVIAGAVTFYDITEQKQAQKAQKEAENKSILLKEIHHRIKNNLQVVSSLLDLQSEQVQDSAAIALLEKSQARIQTMALIHEKLYASKNLGYLDFAEYINSLVNYLYDSLIRDFKQVEISLDIQTIYLNLELATPCGLIISELIANALEHAFVNRLSGEIKLNFSQSAENYYLTIRDNGLGNASEIANMENNTQFLGLSLVSSLVKDQLKGTIKFEQNRGLVIKITFPVR